MRILFVAPYLPSPIRVRTYHFIRGLKERGHEVTFLGLADPYAGEDTVDELARHCRAVEIFHLSKPRSLLQTILWFLRKMPLQSIYCFSTDMHRRISRLASDGNHDLIHVEHIRAAFYLPRVRQIPAVYDSVDCITHLYRQFAREKTNYIAKWVAHIESRRLQASEPAAISRYDQTIVAASRDKDALDALCGTSECPTHRVHVIPNGVDLEHFKPSSGTYDKHSVVFTGKMGYYANELAALHFARDIFPGIKAAVPDARFYIVGANPSRALRKLTRHEDIIVTGRVPDMRDHLASAHVVVCPVRVATGMQNKVLEAMAMAKAVVSYRQAAAPFSTDKTVYVLADDPQEFAQKVIALMTNDTLRRYVEQNARVYVQELHSWPVTIGKLENLYSATISGYRIHAAEAKS